MRLDAFLTEKRARIIERCRVKVAARRAPRATRAELERGIPLFLDHLIEALRLQQREPSSDADAAAARHGSDLLEEGFTVAQVVHDYGDVCQSVIDLAIESAAPISNEEFGILNACIDHAIADAVSEFSRVRDLRVARDSNERLGVLSHEIRNLLSTATLTFDAVKVGRVGMMGATAAVLERTLARLASVVDRSLAHVRLEAGNLQRERVEVAHLLEETEIAATLAARSKGVVVEVRLPDEAGLAVDADAQILSAVVFNLAQNAVKFTRKDGHVVLSARAAAGRVLIDVADECGGLPAGDTEALFRPFEQLSADRSGLGLGLAIARRGVEVHGGELRVKDIPGTGCVFTVELARVQ